MVSAAIPLQRYQTTSLELPGGRNLTLGGSDGLGPPVLDRTEGLITSILDERVQNLLTFESDSPGKEWRTGRDTFLQASFFLGPRRAPRQVVDASWDRREVALITHLDDPHLLRHEVRALFDASGRIIPETITATTHVTVGEGEYFVADGRRYEGTTRL